MGRSLRRLRVLLTLQAIVKCELAHTPVKNLDCLPGPVGRGRPSDRHAMQKNFARSHPNG
jgi:hypothetical protein